MVLAAGLGTRLRPLTTVRPKALCPVAGVPLVDLALERVRAVTPAVAVNAHHGHEALTAHVDGRAHVSLEADRLLGTAGALGRLRPWIDGRGVLVLNADAWSTAELGAVVEGWDGERVRLLVGGDPAAGLGPRTPLVASLLPWADVAALDAEPSGLYARVFAPAAAAGRLELVGHDGPIVDCGTPAGYLRANLLASGGASVVGPGAEVEGVVVRSVVWPGAAVRRHERLVDAVRADDRLTVLVRRAGP